MSYASAQELIDAVPEHLVSGLTGTEEPDTDKIERALADGTAEIDGYLAGRYALPLTTVPDVLRRICVDIALYRLMNLRALGDLEDARKRYEDAVRYLERVADGRVSLGLPAAESESTIASGVDFFAKPRVFEGLGY